MAFQTTAFDLSATEKHSILATVKSLLLRATSVHERARRQQHRSRHDHAEALRIIDHALALATDADACDAALAPLATCSLLKGHILLALGRRAEARDAYTVAATAHTSAVTEAPAAQEAARRLLGMRDEAEETNGQSGADAPRSGVSAPGSWRRIGLGGQLDHEDGLGELGLSFLLADMRLPVAIRPGPAKKGPVLVHRR
ncbi:hypothetical protein F5Y19DRAFT_479436 [Xylariaceae sp. FL1651]|nr:hypothetical protein F5Y19DRAFT_479436 [Xylariaceae sp. FL1651]